MAEVFNYTPAQSYNIRRGLHPDCCASDVCAACGASESNLLACNGDLHGLVLDLFREADCSARNANTGSIGQFTNWSVHDRRARTFDAAARALFSPPLPANPSAGASTVNNGSQSPSVDGPGGKALS